MTQKNRAFEGGIVSLSLSLLAKIKKWISLAKLDQKIETGVANNTSISGKVTVICFQEYKIKTE